MPAHIFPSAENRRNSLEALNKLLSISDKVSLVPFLYIPSGELRAYLELHGLTSYSKSEFEHLEMPLPLPQGLIENLETFLGSEAGEQGLLAVYSLDASPGLKLVTLTMEELTSEILSIWKGSLMSDSFDDDAIPSLCLSRLGTPEFVGEVYFDKEKQLQVRYTNEGLIELWRGHELEQPGISVEWMNGENCPGINFEQLKEVCLHVGAAIDFSHFYWFQVSGKILVSAVVEGPKNTDSVSIQGNAVSPGLAAGLLVAAPTDVLGAHDVLYISKAVKSVLPEQVAQCQAVIQADTSPYTTVAIACRLLHKPCVTGIILTEPVRRDLVTVNGNSGLVEIGAQSPAKKKAKVPKTNTQLLVVASPDQLYAPIPEFLDGILAYPAGHIYSHYLKAKSSQEYYVQKMAEVIAGQASRLGHQKPFLFSLLNYDSYQDVKQQFLNVFKTEDSAYLFARYARALEIESQAVALVRGTSISNVHLLLPPVSSAQELKDLKTQLYHHGLKRTANFDFYMQIKAPANLYLVQDYLTIGLDGLVLRMDDLATNFLGSGFDVRMAEDSALYKLLEESLQAADKAKVKVYAQGELLHQSPDLVQKLVKWRVTGLGVSLDHALRIKRDVKRNEVNISKNKHRWENE